MPLFAGGGEESWRMIVPSAGFSYLRPILLGLSPTKSEGGTDICVKTFFKIFFLFLDFCSNF